MRIKQIEILNTPRDDSSWQPVILLRALFDMYGFDYPRGTLPATLLFVVNAEDLTTPSAGGMKDLN